MSFVKFDMKKRLRNKNRSVILTAIYKETQRYQDLIDLTGLKPGSLYHHLRILDDLIEKKDHGMYAITELGKEVAEFHQLIDATTIKPSISKSRDENEFKEIISEDLLSKIWIGPGSSLLIGFIFLMTLILGFEGVALAGSAIYFIGFPMAFVFDIVAIILGSISLFVIFKLLDNKRKEIMQETILIRSFSMFPGSIVGISIYLLFLVDSLPTQNVFDFLFGLTLLFGLLFTATGIYYLKNQTMSESIAIAFIPTSIDMLIGIVVLLSE